MLFTDRIEAGRKLAERLGHLAGSDVVVVGLPRGGIPVAAEVARALDAPLDAILVRKLGVPHQPELAMGAIGENGVRVVDAEIVRMARVSPNELAAVERAERSELARRARRYREGRSRISLRGRQVVIVDDGIATGSTAKAACQVARAEGAGRVVLAVPVAPPDWWDRLSGYADELVCVATPEPFYGVGQFYRRFTQTTDEEVIAHLERDGRAAVPDPPSESDVVIDVNGARLPGHLTIPPDATGLVLFAHGSGSSRHSPRNRHVAHALERAHLATLLFDLLTPDEEVDRANVFDIGLLGRRLVEATAWARRRAELSGLAVGYFGASTGAGAALWAAAEPGIDVAAVVSRGGRPDLAGLRLGAVTAPTLLVVGGRDLGVLDLNREAGRHLGGPWALEVVPGASHLFEEPGALDVVASLAAAWFGDHLVVAPRSG